MDLSADPLSVLVSRTAKELSRAFDDALAAAGGSTPIWLVLQAMARESHRTQGDLAASMGIQQPTLTHHLDAMEGAGFVTRVREAGNRRVQRVTMTDAGRQLFLRLRRTAASL